MVMKKLKKTLDFDIRIGILFIILFLILPIPASSGIVMGYNLIIDIDLMRANYIAAFALFVISIILAFLIVNLYDKSRGRK